jgi:3' terminal RNA ribose 2'-O-methyltransferase Hen1
VLLTITTTREPATDLGFLLHKHPDRAQSFDVSAGVAHVFYPQAADGRCTVALLLEVDPIALVRGKHRELLVQYVNDRPYAASSMLTVAMKEAFRTALTGRCDARPELAAMPIPLELHVPALRCKGGAELARRVFEPLGWTVDVTPVPLEPVPGFEALRGDSPYVDLRLTGTVRLKDALNHLYVLLPALDDAKHYWVSTDEVDKLIRAGGDWLAGHPEKALITRRYLAHRRSLTESALARLEETGEDLDNAVAADEADEDSAARKPLAVQRREAIVAVLRAVKARSVGDFGCGAGALTKDLLAERDIDLVVAVDVSARALQLAGRRLHLERMTARRRERLKIFQSALTYRDDRLAGLDAAALMEVIEHVDPGRLPALERSVFGFATPGTVVVTTPNAEYNPRYPNLGDRMRHPDHRFEWTRAEFADWAGRVCADYGYRVEVRGVGDPDDTAGAPTQLAVFTKEAT